MRFTLNQFKDGDRIKIVELKGGINFIRKINEMGIRIGSEIEIFSHCGKGQIIVKINGARLGMGCGMSDKIIGEKIV